MAAGNTTACSTPSWNDQEKVEAVRLAWETLANRALERAGFDARIDRRSLAAQGISRAAEPKMGNAAWQVGQFLRRAQSSKVPVAMADLSERAQAAISVRYGRELDQQRSAVVIELAKVREERAAKEQARAEHRQRLEALPLDELRVKVQTLKPASTELGRPVWESEWKQLPVVISADREAKEALHAVGQAEGKLTAVAQRLEDVFQAEQAYKKAHWFKSALHAMVGKNTTLKAFDTEHTTLEQRQVEDRQQLALADQQRRAAEAKWKGIASDPMLQAQARESHGDKVAWWEDAQQILVRREAERSHAETLVEQLVAAQRLGVGFDRQRVPESVRYLLRRFDARPQIIPAVAGDLVERFARDASKRQLVEKALAPQKQIIDREVQRMAVQRERGGGYER